MDSIEDRVRRILLYALSDLNNLPGKHVFFAKWSSDDTGAHLKSL